MSAARAPFAVPFFFITVAAFAQGERPQPTVADDVYIRGLVKNHADGSALPDARIDVMCNAVRIAVLRSDSTGWYAIQMPFDKLYLLRFSKDGMVAKSVQVDTRSIPVEQRSGGLGMHIDVTLFDTIPGADFSFLDEPIGKAAWSPADSMVTWDMPWTEAQRSRIARTLLEHGGR